MTMTHIRAIKQGVMLAVSMMHSGGIIALHLTVHASGPLQPVLNKSEPGQYAPQLEAVNLL